MKEKKEEINQIKVISEKVFKHWKRISAVSLLAIIGLTFIIGFLIKDRNSLKQEKMALITQMKSLQDSSQKITEQPPAVDPSVLKDKMEEINKQIEAINLYLKARGIKNKVFIPKLTDSASPENISKIMGSFGHYLAKTEYDFAHIPLGYPYKGRITSRFGQREDPFNHAATEGHSGMDIKAPMGAPVKAMAKGTVIFAGRQNGYGNCIIIRHINGIETLYGHLSKILVRNGNSIEIGEVIGKVGSTGRSTGPHLHYEIRRNGQRINPASFLSLNGQEKTGAYNKPKFIPNIL